MAHKQSCLSYWHQKNVKLSKFSSIAPVSSKTSLTQTARTVQNYRREGNKGLHLQSKIQRNSIEKCSKKNQINYPKRSTQRLPTLFTKIPALMMVMCWYIHRPIWWELRKWRIKRADKLAFYFKGITFSNHNPP